jgi:lysophospholipase L1-like esterase
MNTENTDRDRQSFKPTRRQFVGASAGLTAAGLAALAATDKLFAQAAPVAAGGKPLIQPGDVILFQGDSITDAGRKRDKESIANSPNGLGYGYAWLAASQLLVDRPDDGLKIYNRGISGNKVFQLAERWQKDCLDLKPNVLSLLIGVNDIWHTMKHDYNGTVEIYETDYRKLLAATKEALPDVRLVVCEPFVLRFGAVEDRWFPDFDEYRAAAKRVADEAGALFIPYQAMFDVAAKVASPERWLQDGVHPKPDGAALMAHWWLRATG